MKLTWKILKSFADDDALVCVRVENKNKSEAKSPIYLYALRVNNKFYYFYKWYIDTPHLESVWEYIGNRRPERK